MKLFELFVTILLDDKQFTDGVKRATAAGKQMAGGFETISAKAVALGNVISTLGIKAAQMAGNFAKSAIDAGAQVKAEKAQFDAAFGDMANSATKALKNVQGETGILYTRLRTVGTKAFSQLRGAGVETAEAMEAMEKYTGLAADAAAYYDISLEEADAKLRSFMRGNTEAGDAIGLFTSETQRNERAVEKYGKKWLQLTEAQKQLLMLDVANSIYDQSGAIGQAARESDSWANIVGNLQSAWTNAIAKIGEPVTESVTPALQAVIDKLGDEETLEKIEQFGLGLANKITALYENEDSPVRNVLRFVGDIGSAFSSETGQSVINAVGTAGLAIWALSSPINAVIAGVALIATNWDKVKNAIHRADAAQTAYQRGVAEKKQMLSNGVYEATGSRTLGDVLAEYTYATETNPDAPWLAGMGETVSWIKGLFSKEDSPPTFETDDNIQTVDLPGFTPDNPYGIDLSTLGISGYAKGLSYVPYDNYIARLHRGEEVLTAAEARQRRSGQGADVSALYSAVAAAVRDGVSRIAINMDGQRVGRAVAGSVSREQARMTNNDLRAGGYAFT